MNPPPAPQLPYRLSRQSFFTRHWISSWPDERRVFAILHRQLFRTHMAVSHHPAPLFCGNFDQRLAATMCPLSSPRTLAKLTTTLQHDEGCILLLFRSGQHPRQNSPRGQDLTTPYAVCPPPFVAVSCGRLLRLLPRLRKGVHGQDLRRCSRGHVRRRRYKFHPIRGG